jgi:hypothetical protein
VTSFPPYERLPATETNVALLSSTARHADAAVDDDTVHYEAALERLNPKLRCGTSGTHWAQTLVV